MPRLEQTTRGTSSRVDVHSLLPLRPLRARGAARGHLADRDGEVRGTFGRLQSQRADVERLVAQDDSLLQGTIAENISGFDEQIDMGRVRECAEHAQINKDIERMPMGYESLVGDMGSLPRILILDEGNRTAGS